VTTEQAQDAPDIVLDTFSYQLCACNSFIWFRSITFFRYWTIRGKAWYTYEFYEDTFAD
jgi:hypothetical protein